MSFVQIKIKLFLKNVFFVKNCLLTDDAGIGLVNFAYLADSDYLCSTKNEI